MANSDWALNGNAGTNPPNDFLGTTDDQALIIKTNGEEVIHIDPQGKVGIGATNPGQKLDVEGFVVAANGPSAFETTCDDSGTHFWTNNAYSRRDPFANWTQTLTMHVGKVGIGTTTPHAKLDISASGDLTSPQVEIAQTTPSDFARLRFVSLGVDPDSGTRPFPSWDIAAGRGVLNFFRQGTGNVMSLTSGREPGTATFSPRVGIGTESPQAALDVNGTVRVEVLEITGGADLAESFSVAENAVPEPGTVMVIDECYPDRLKVSDSAYDRKVAGIVTGASGIGLGLALQGDSSREQAQVALAGRVYCKAEAISNAIEPGDLLTSSHVRGHAMKAIDPDASQGAVLGKAMSALCEDRGLVLILVNLQ